MTGSMTGTWIGSGHIVCHGAGSQITVLPDCQELKVLAIFAF